ncbi:hypothetical protein CEXT_648631 [Caerostris extrusa]|uniref:Uncharacterized protein n=1 Tax=Caerostris extrusa TaxID=172846 RepID=A0AAV4N688_CAEEX|nr:hypothetical protein CEXT_648631 [Caerostris extrusa]
MRDGKRRRKGRGITRILMRLISSLQAFGRCSFAQNGFCCNSPEGRNSRDWISPSSIKTSFPTPGPDVHYANVPLPVMTGVPFLSDFIRKEVGKGPIDGGDSCTDHSSSLSRPSTNSV